jgi:hypothetical protein
MLEQEEAARSLKCRTEVVVSGAALGPPSDVVSLYPRLRWGPSCVALSLQPPWWGSSCGDSSLHHPPQAHYLSFVGEILQLFRLEFAMTSVIKLHHLLVLPSSFNDGSLERSSCSWLNADAILQRASSTVSKSPRQLVKIVMTDSECLRCWNHDD